MVQGGPLWALCFYHFRCTMPTVPAAAPFTSVSACLTTFMELIAPVLAHRPTIYLPFILYSISGSLPFTGASRPAPLILPGCWCWCCCCSCSESVPRQCLLCPLIHSVPFFRLALFFLFACLAGFLFLCSLAGTARNFLHMFTAWIFYGLKCFQLESFASLPLLLLCASCTLQKYKDAHKFIRLVSCSSTDIVGCESKAKGKCCSNSCPA